MELPTEITENDVLMKQPFRLICSGASGVGKTYFVKDFIENLPSFTNKTFDKIIYSYMNDQPLYSSLQHSTPLIQWIKGSAAETEDFLQDGNLNKLLVIDDQMLEPQTTKFLLNLFTRLSHHTNTSVIYITQNMFFQNKCFRTISLNATSFCIFKNPRDQRQIRYIAGQICPWNPRYICEAFKDATQKPFSYLFIDLWPDVPDSLRLRSSLLDAQGQTVYLEK
jgi:hypothetical protein